MKITRLYIAVLFYCSHWCFSYRLSRDVFPVEYSLKFQPNLDADWFDGEVNITVQTKVPRDNITLHSKKLNILEARSNGGLLNVTDATIRNKITVLFEDGRTFEAGEHVVFLKFTGKYGEYGLIRTEYGDGDDKKVLIANEFEPVGARNAFPCFDEPGFKAHFNIQLVTPNETYFAISNMPEISHTPVTGGILYKFDRSPKMSTYLISLAITNYSSYRDSFEVNHTTYPVTIYTRNSTETNNKLTVDIAKDAVEFYTNYTGIDYVLAKLDMIEYKKSKALATETWGLIQFREEILTYSRQSDYLEKRSKLVISHELGHFWFGNLVTIDWWNDLWIQEGLTSYLSTKFANEHFLTEFHIMDIIELFSFENETDVKPLVVAAKNAETTENLFSDIVYKKGEALFQALEAAVGAEAFQSAIRKYLTEFSFKSVTSEDLVVKFVNERPDLKVRSFLESYMYQSGIPVLNVNQRNGSYIVTQHDIWNTGRRWTIPVSYLQGNQTKQAWFDKDATEVTIHPTEETEWILLNSHESSGLYLVNYSTALLESLISHLEDIPLADLNNLARNVETLYMQRLINCSPLIRVMEKTLDVSEKTFRSFTLGLFELLKDLSCFEPQYKVVMAMISKKLVIQEVILSYFHITCTEKDRINNVHNGRLKECTDWIDDYFKE